MLTTCRNSSPQPPQCRASGLRIFVSHTGHCSSIFCHRSDGGGHKILSQYPPKRSHGVMICSNTCPVNHQRSATYRSRHPTRRESHRLQTQNATAHWVQPLVRWPKHPSKSRQRRCWRTATVMNWRLIQPPSRSCHPVRRKYCETRYCRAGWAFSLVSRSNPHPGWRCCWRK